MPVTSITEARDDILDVFKTAWDAGTTAIVGSVPEVRYHIVEVADTPPEDSYWAWVAVEHVDGGHAAIGTVLFEHEGIFTVQLYGPSTNEGLANVDALVDLVLVAFEGKCSDNGVWFRNARVNEVGPERGFFQVNVLVDFVYTLTRQ